MEIRYRENRQDFIRWHRLNKTGVVSQWRNYLLVAAALVPAAITLAILGSNYATLWVSIAIAVMLFLAVFRYFVPLVAFKPRDAIDTFNDHMLTRKGSRSITQLKWEVIEEFRETGRDFEFWRLDVGSIVPKGSMSDEQKQQLRELIARVQTTPSGDSPAVPVYAERILADGDFPVYRYQYDSTDAGRISGSPLRPYQTSSSEVNRRSGGRLLLQFGFLTFACVFGCTMVIREIRQQDFLGMVLRDLLVCMIPFLALLVISRIRTRFRITKLFRLPTDEIAVRPCHDGIVMGTADAVSLIHWTDINSFYVNDHFVGLHTIHQTIQMIPKRAIGDEAAVERFIESAIELKNVADRETVQVAQAEPVHSDNPYQAPMNQ
jgi:hypothetical protein